MSGFFRAHSQDRHLRVKICGITNARDAAVAIDAGADAIGLNFYRGSKRYIDIEKERAWLSNLPSQVARVAVLVNPTPAEAIAVSELPFIDALQLHGEEPAELCRTLQDRHIPFAKAVRPQRDDLAANFHTNTLLLDSLSLSQFGGTGETFPWHLARRWIDNFPDHQFILAGGLTPENVADAIRAVRPFAVDVTSGVEASIGRKDSVRMRDFIEAARAALA
jgi:phosphoribosylanthranilate isomerase